MVFGSGFPYKLDHLSIYSMNLAVLLLTFKKKKKDNDTGEKQSQHKPPGKKETDVDSSWPHAATKRYLASKGSVAYPRCSLALASLPPVLAAGPCASRQVLRARTN
jgi:hypothetical protein